MREERESLNVANVEKTPKLSDPLTRQSKTRADGGIACEICWKRFKRFDSLQRHTKLHKVETTDMFRCEVCEKQYSRKYNLNRHLKNHRESELVASRTSSVENLCNLCGKTFNRSDVFMKHVNTHDKKSVFPCQTCHAIFSRKDNLHRHMQKHYQFMLQLSCKKCGKSFCEKNSFVDHIKDCIQTGNGGRETAFGSLTQKQKEIGRVCKICDARFTRHMMIHNNHRFRCDSCGKSWTRQHKLKQHACNVDQPCTTQTAELYPKQTGPSS